MIPYKIEEISGGLEGRRRLVPIPDEVHRMAEEADRCRQGWYGEGKPNHWKEKDEQVLGNVAEIMAEAMCREWGVSGLHWGGSNGS